MVGPSVRRLLIALVVVLAAQLVTPAAGADDLSDARRRRDEARRERAEAAAELDTLEANDAELEAAARELESQVRAQRAQVADARRAREAAEADVVAARGRLAAATAEVDSLEDLVRRRAVAAYVNPAGTEITTILASLDLNEAARKETFIRHVARNDRGLLDRFRSAREDRQVQEEASEAAAGRAARQQQDEETALVRLEETQAAQARVQEALDARIARYRAEVDALAAQEAELTDVIRRYEEAQRREAQRREAERRAREEAERREAARRARAEAEARAQRDRDRDRGAPSDTGDQPQSPSASGLIWPVRGPVTSEFGWRWGRMHKGIDIAAGTGTPIRAAASGTVIYAGWMNGYGNVVLVGHGSLTTVYAHQSRLGSSEGQAVGQGEVIGYVGSTGHSTGPHLHFETRVDGVARNPRNYLP